MSTEKYGAIMKLFIFALFSVLMLNITSCGGNKSASTSQESSVVYGSAKSTDMEYLNVDIKFNTYSSTTVGDERSQLLLEKYDFSSKDERSIWSLAVRTFPDPYGVVNVEDVSIKLFSRYKREEKCCINTHPFEYFDLAEKSYVAVSGYIDFESQDVASFDLNFQEELTVGGGELIGQIVNVKGCWSISPGESPQLGCTLD